MPRLAQACPGRCKNAFRESYLAPDWPALSSRSYCRTCLGRGPYFLTLSEKLQFRSTEDFSPQGLSDSVSPTSL